MESQLVLKVVAGVKGWFMKCSRDGEFGREFRLRWLGEQVEIEAMGRKGCGMGGVDFGASIF
jgi:hypothetical protein